MPTKRKCSAVQPASGSGATDTKFKVFSTLRNKLRRNRTTSVDNEPSDKLSELTVGKCQTLPARVGGGASPNKTQTLYWMAEVVDELEGSLVSTPPVTREDSEESVDSGFHQSSKEDQEPKVMVVPAKSPSDVGKIYDVATVERAFGPMKDVGRWYSSYNTARQLEESRYVHRPLRLQHSLEEEERLASRPLPPIPQSESNRTPPPIRNEESVYERVEHRMLGSNGLCLGLRDLSNHGWYWGPITRVEAEERLSGANDGTFLVRDSSDERYLLSLSFRSQGKTLHTRIEYSNGYFSFYSFPDSDTDGYSSVVELIENSMQHSQEGVFCFSRARALGSPAVPVRLLKPFSRFNHVRTLQHYCRFVIRQSIRFDFIRELPLPRHVHGFLEQSQF